MSIHLIFLVLYIFFFLNLFSNQKMPSIDNNVVHSWSLFFQTLFLQIQITQSNIYRLGQSIHFLFFLLIHTFIPRLSYVKDIATVNHLTYGNTSLIYHFYCYYIYCINEEFYSCINHELEKDDMSGHENFYHRKHGRYKY